MDKPQKSTYYSEEEIAKRKLSRIAHELSRLTHEQRKAANKVN